MQNSVITGPMVHETVISLILVVNYKYTPVSVAVVADVSGRSPQTFIVYIIEKNVFWVKVSQICFISC